MAAYARNMGEISGVGLMEKQIVHLFVFNTLPDWETGFATAGINNPAFLSVVRLQG